MRLALGAAADGVEVVVALGGDGTLNEAANGLAGSQSALAVLPGGSTNVFARSIGFVNDPIEATGQLLTALGRPGSIRPVGLASLNGRYFLCNAGVGFDAAVIARVERRGGLKRWAGHPLFVVHRLHHLAPLVRPEPSPPGGGVRRRVTAGRWLLRPGPEHRPLHLLGNRPLRVSPDASLDRGLALATFRTLSAFSVPAHDRLRPGLRPPAQLAADHRPAHGPGPVQHCLPRRHAARRRWTANTSGSWTSAVFVSTSLTSCDWSCPECDGRTLGVCGTRHPGRPRGPAWWPGASSVTARGAARATCSAPGSG